MAGGIGYIFYETLKFFLGVNNPSSLAKKDGQKLRNALGPYLDKLVPLSDGELELFSLNRTTTKKRKGLYHLTTGVYRSIYQEPLLAFAYKQYRGKPVSILMAKTVDDEFFYISMKGNTQVYHNGQALGVVTSDGDLLTPNRQHLMARIAPEDILTLHPIEVGGREVGKILNPQKVDGVNPRAFQFLASMDQKEKTLFLSLAILSVIEEQG